ncbi:hypothetical protein HanPSC8_Chr12g0506721 [Helianthus annuus]|nr:hypothetical protein HanHA89_Chr12g0455591 [Helianthus annuus]KAJ0673790.1 hypothetical protein HanLR1_Chr12g0432891 [Helianthus annuus]KAJ0861444.1 hypothetical protein HanPSC8_Chr12g0506721 [Helianthus annuus]
MLENHHLDFIKQTMLKHEDTFRRQVRELHRLYDVQRNMTTTLRSETRQHTEFAPQTAFDINNDDSGLIMPGFDISRHGDTSGIHDDQTWPDDVELTLNIGPSIGTRRSQNHHPDSGTLYNQDNKRPHWLIQDLSLHRT